MGLRAIVSHLADDAVADDRPNGDRAVVCGLVAEPTSSSSSKHGLEDLVRTADKFVDLVPSWVSFLDMHAQVSEIR